MTFCGPWDGWFILNHVFAIRHNLFWGGGGVLMGNAKGWGWYGQSCRFIKADGGLGGAESVLHARLRAHGHAHTKGPQSRC